MVCVCVCVYRDAISVLVGIVWTLRGITLPFLLSISVSKFDAYERFVICWV